MIRTFLLVIFFLFLVSVLCRAQKLSDLFDTSLKPFYYGVASGDPTSDRVIIWTKVEPEKADEQIEVKWVMAADPELKKIIKQGKQKTSMERDFTVKVDVTGLAPGNTYYYQFMVGGTNSIIGRTKTTPQNSDHLRFAVLSCSNYQAGYFNAYARIADRNDLDAVIHLGDYIYEYGNGGYGDSALNASGKRKLIPDNEILSLQDYRSRYALYRLDPDLRRAHQQHPFIVVWDDHESANNSYKEGAQNHGENNKNEGNWQDRKNISKRVYAEWLPIRGNAAKIYRSISYGNLAELILLDTRLEGRDKQIEDVTNPELYKEDRTILGKEQKEWLMKRLKNSEAKWKIVGNQITFAEFNIGWAAMAIPGMTEEKAENLFLDFWDGYPAERNQLINFMQNEQINNIVFITGDVHASFAYDIALRPSVLSKKNEAPTYDSGTGKGSVAVEFVTPSINSSNFDEHIGLQKAKILEYQINKPLPKQINPNPHLKYCELTQHGYFLLDLTSQKAQADWYFVDTVKQVSSQENFGQGWFTLDKENHLKKAEEAIKGKAKQDTPAPMK